MDKKIAFFDTKSYDRQSFDMVNRDFNFGITYFEHRLNTNTVDLATGFDAVCVFVNDIIDKGVIKALVENKVGVIALRCAGYNNIDCKAAANSISVVRVPAYSPYAVAEHATALMLALNRKTHKAYYRTRDGNFSIKGLLGFDMHTKTAGIIGMGRIGRCLVSILKGFGMKILAFDAYPDNAYAKSAGIEYVSLKELYSNSDIISLHCPLIKETEHMINEKSINQMKDGVMLINTGRGKLIDAVALIKGLKRKKIGSAGLDVYEQESGYFFEDLSSEMIADDVLARLLTFPNVLITSHQGFFTVEALTRIATTTLNNLKEFFKGEKLTNEVCNKAK